MRAALFVLAAGLAFPSTGIRAADPPKGWEFTGHTQATTVDVRANFAVMDNISLYVASDNVFNTRVASSKGADGIVNYSAPRLVRAGLSFAN